MKRLVGDFEKLFREETRWIDVRAPVEFKSGAVPGAINLPLLSDDERHAVGLTYKEKGQSAAIELGHRLVGGATKESRVRAWLEEAAANPRAVIYCFRGGLRSQIVQGWLREHSVDRPIVDGGYKALRRFLLETLNHQSQALRFEVVTGPTGSGKTAYLHSSGRPFLDLESLAVHRGSAFGAQEKPQPNQVDFENALALALLHFSEITEPILVEDESRLIGHCSIPEPLFQKMKTSPRIRIGLPLEARVENIFRDYVVESSLGHQSDMGRFTDFRRSVRAISRRLGGQRSQEVLGDLDFSQSEFAAGRGLDSNRIWIRKLLEWYYDPLYERKG